MLFFIILSFIKEIFIIFALDKIGRLWKLSDGKNILTK